MEARLLALGLTRAFLQRNSPVAASQATRMSSSSLPTSQAAIQEIPASVFSGTVVLNLVPSEPPGRRVKADHWATPGLGWGLKFTFLTRGLLLHLGGHASQ